MKKRHTALLITFLFLCAASGSCGNVPEKTKAFDTAASQDLSRKGAEQEIVVIIGETEDGSADRASLEAGEASESHESAAQKVMYAMAELNIRTAPSTDAKKAGKYSEGDEVMALGEKDGEWTAVYYDGSIMYAASKYLTRDRDWKKNLRSSYGYADGEPVRLDPSWRYAEYSEINSGHAVMYLAGADRNNIVIGINAGHGTEGGSSVKTWCHPDRTEKVTGGTTAAGAVKAAAVSGGMRFDDGTPESSVTLKEARILRDFLLKDGYDVLMVRDGTDVQLDNIARTVICNNAADCHIAIHWDGDSLSYDKGCFYMSVPDGIKYIDNVASVWEKSEALGDSLIKGLRDSGAKIFDSGHMDMDLTQTAYSSVPSVDIELGSQSSVHDDETLKKLAEGLLRGINIYFGF